MHSLKFRAWLKNYSCYADVLGFEQGKLFIQFQSGERSQHRLYVPIEDCILEQYTGLKDKNGDKEIYEYDIIDGEGNIIGNYHETPELLKDKTNLLIQGFGTKTWLTTYQEAVERGCHDA